MKGSLTAASAVLLSLVQSIAVVGIPTTPGNDNPVQASNITFSVYGMTNEPTNPFDIYADTTLGVWVNSDRAPQSGNTAAFIWDPNTNTVVLDDNAGVSLVDACHGCSILVVIDTLTRDRLLKRFSILDLMGDG